MAASAGVEGAGELHPFLVILPTKSRIAFYEIQLLLRARGRGITRTWTPSARRILPNSFRSKTIRSGFSRSTTGTSTITSPISPGTSGRYSICCSNSPRARLHRPAESISRNSSILRRGRTGLRSGSIRRIPGCRVQDIHALIADRKSADGIASERQETAVRLLSRLFGRHDKRR